jgi:hypothetical protein
VSCNLQHSGIVDYIARIKLKGRAELPVLVVQLDTAEAKKGRVVIVTLAIDNTQQAFPHFVHCSFRSTLHNIYKVSYTERREKVA